MPPLSPSKAAPQGKILGTFTATAYGPPWNAMEGTGVTSTGVDLRQGQQKLVVAVDPSVIPYGTKLRIWPNPWHDPSLIFTASDTGGAFQGGVRKVDFFIASGRKAQNGWGVRRVLVTRVGKGSPKSVGLLGSSSKRAAGFAQDAPGIVQQETAPADPQDAWSSAGMFAPLLRASVTALVWIVLILGGAGLVAIGAGRVVGAGKAGSS